MSRISIEVTKAQLARLESLAKQRERERGDSLSFDEFLADYFGTRQTTS